MLWFIALGVQAFAVHAWFTWSTERRRDYLWREARDMYLEAKKEYENKWIEVAKALPDQVASREELDHLAQLREDERLAHSLVCVRAEHVSESLQQEADRLKAALDDKWTVDSGDKRTAYIKCLTALLKVKEVIKYAPQPTAWQMVMGVGVADWSVDAGVHDLKECPLALPVAEAVTMWRSANGRVRMFEVSLQRQIQVRARDAEDAARQGFRAIYGPAPRIHEYDNHKSRPEHGGQYHPPVVW